MTVTEKLIQAIEDDRAAYLKGYTESLERTREWFTEFDGVGLA